MDIELTLRELFEIDDLCCQFEKAWRPDTQLLESYLAKASERQLPTLLLELVAVECELLGDLGRESSCVRIANQYPQLRSVIEESCAVCPARNGGPLSSDELT